MAEPPLLSLLGVSKSFGAKPATILQNNMVQTTGSAGESVAAGIVFTLPALLLLGYNLPWTKVAAVAVVGGLLGVFLMIPPDIKAADMRKRQNELGEKLAQAVKATKPQRVVFLSSIYGQMKEGTGPILGLHDMEERLNGLGIPELVYLRPTFFMENHLPGVPLIAQAGIYGTAFRPDVLMPMIATADIGAKAAEMLTEDPFRQPRTRELLGPRDYTMVEVTRILGSAIGKPDLKYVQFPYEDARKAMTGMGISARTRLATFAP